MVCMQKNLPIFAEKNMIKACKSSSHFFQQKLLAYLILRVQEDLTNT